MSSAVYVERAAKMAKFLEDREVLFGGDGDREMARARLEARYGVAQRVFYSLRYRPPKQIAADIYLALCVAIEDAGTRHIRALEHDVATARASNLSVSPSAIRKVEIFLDEMKAIDGEVE